MNRKKKIISWLRAMLPFLYCLLIQVYVGAIFGQIFKYSFSYNWIQDNLIVILLIAHAFTVFFFGLWYFTFCMNEHDTRVKDVLSVRSVATVILLGFGLQYVTRAFFILIDTINPQILESYSELIQSTGLGETSIISMIATVILAPIGEECVFRGVTMRLLHRTGVKFWVINFVQALLFGIMHGNLVQGVYAFALGLVLGLIVYRYKSILMGILLHLTYNLLGVTASWIPFEDSVVLQVAVIVLAVFAAAFGLILCLKETPRERPNDGKKYSFASYMAMTSKLYRTLVHIVFPALILFVGVIAVLSANASTTIVVTVASFLLLVELSGDFVAFGASSSKDSASINWMKSSVYGKQLLTDTYLWDIGIRFFKTTVMWGVMGIYPAFCGGFETILIGYLVYTAITFLAVNFIRRIPNPQMTVIVTMPAILIVGFAIGALSKLTAYLIPISACLGVLMIASMVVTYKLSMRSFKRTYYDVL